LLFGRSKGELEVILTVISPLDDRLKFRVIMAYPASGEYIAEGERETERSAIPLSQANPELLARLEAARQPSKQG